MKRVVARLNSGKNRVICAASWLRQGSCPSGDLKSKSFRAIGARMFAIAMVWVVQPTLI